MFTEVIIITAFWALPTAGVPTTDVNVQNDSAAPYSILDEAFAQLEDLRALVVAQIFIVHDELDSLRQETILYSNSTSINGQMSIAQASNTISTRLRLAKSMGSNTDIDLSSCFVEETNLNRLPSKKVNDLKLCIDDITTQFRTIVDDAKYTADIQYNTVNQLEFQLNSCRDASILCISPIVSQIELNMVQLPQKIGTELDNAVELIENLRPLFGGCRDNNVAQYTAEANAIMRDIFSCINALLS